MFESIKKVLGLGAAADAKVNATVSVPNAAPTLKLTPEDKVTEWASTHGFAFSPRADGRRGYQVEGKVGGKDWRIELGKPSRDFIKGMELRARAELGVRDDVIMVMSRQLKNELDKRAFELYTDTLQTIADPNLPEEMRWLSIYEEVGWESLGTEFLDHYAVLSDDRVNAMAWITNELVDLLMAWPAFDPATPMILMVLRGKAYLRMQFVENDLPTLEHATSVFTTACELALSAQRA
jgi:hypothetical protein